ncbi:MAG: HNH endonuclease [Reyranella sp.]|nr:HNH endonuclease [Reyranella sp.]
MADRQKPTLKARRTVFYRSRGYCEYVSCNRRVATWSGGNVELIGASELAHILPVGDEWARSEYKKDYPNLDLNHPENLLLLCEHHHNYVDREAPEKHTPAVLFEIARRKHDMLERGIDELFSTSLFNFDLEGLLDDVRVGRILELLAQADLAGPRKGRDLVRQADAQLRDVLKNPYIKVANEFCELLALELLVAKTANSYRADHWRAALKQAIATIRKLKEVNSIASAILTCSVFVRDEYGVFTTDERVGFIKLLLDKLDPLISNSREAPGLAAFLLSQKAGLLRWRGRLQRSKAQQSSFSESERCADLGLRLRKSPAGMMQLALTKYTAARALPLQKADVYETTIDEVTATIASDYLNDYSPAIKYRARFFRDTYEPEKAIDAFWRCVDAGYQAECRRTAFILGEAASLSYVLGEKETVAVVNAAEFLHEAITAGYDHERTFMAWIMCKAILDPQWFRDSVHAKFNPQGALVDFMKLLYHDASRYFGAEAFGQDVLFGVREAEFWNMLARLSRTVLNDPDAALAYYERAEHHDRSPGGSFTTKVGRVRAYLQKKQPEFAGRYLGLIKQSARAYQAPVVKSLEAALAMVS